MKILGGRWGGLLLVLAVLAVAGVLLTLQIFQEPPVLEPAVDLNAPGVSMRPVTIYGLEPDTLAIVPVDRVVLEHQSERRTAQDLIAYLAAGSAEYRGVLPPETELIHFFKSPEGEAVLNFNAAVEQSHSGSVAEERLRLIALARTLTDNIPGIQSLRILVHGRPLERWGNHLRLEAVIDVEARL